MSDGTIEHILAISRDITERKKVEEAPQKLKKYCNEKCSVKA